MAERQTTNIARLVRAAPFRFALGSLALLLPLAALFAGLVQIRVADALADATLEQLRAELRGFRGDLQRGGLPALIGAINARVDEHGRGLYRLTMPGAAVPLAGNLGTRPPGASTAGGVFKVTNADGLTHEAAGIVVAVPGGGELLVARDIEDQRAFATSLQRLVFSAVGVLSIAAIGLGWLASRRSSRRVATIAATMGRITDGDLAGRLPRDNSGDEIDVLAAGVNTMLGRIEDLMGALREVSDNIAHDLKTPLTRLRTHVEAALRDGTPEAQHNGLERTLEEADGLIQTFNALLLIARLEAGAVDETRSPADLAELVGGLVELYQPVAEEAGLTLALTAPAPVWLPVNRQLVSQAVANLIDNAIKYSAGTSTAASSSISVSVAAPAAGLAEIAVADRGPGIPAADRDRVMRRFVRLEQSRSRPGTGLGLSLIAAVARLHGGGVRLEDNDPGLRVVFTLTGAAMEPASGLAEAAVATDHLAP